jgi:hypothetical protein
VSLLTETADALTNAIKAAVPSLASNTERTYRPRWQREDLPGNTVFVGVAPQRTERERVSRGRVERRPRVVVVVSGSTPEQATESSVDVFENAADSVIEAIDSDANAQLTVTGGVCDLESVEVIGLDRTRFAKDDTIYAGVFLLAFEIEYRFLPS